MNTPIDFKEREAEIDAFIDGGASINLMVRRMKLQHDQALRKWLKNERPDLYTKATENGKRHMHLGWRKQK